MNERMERVSRTVLDLLGEHLPTVLPDDLYPHITLMNAKVSKDFSYVDVSVFIAAPDEEKQAEFFTLLESHSYKLQSLIAHNIRLRRTPHLRLHLDRNLEYSQHIDELMRRIKEQEAGGAGD